MQVNNSVKVVNEKLDRANQAGIVVKVKAGKILVKMDVDGEEIIFNKTDLLVL